MSQELLKAAYTRLQQKQGYLKKNYSYAYGKNYKIHAAKDTPQPDNRIAVPLGKSAVSDIVGYAGRPGEIQTEYRATQENGKQGADPITELFASFDLHNEEGIENSELLTRSLSVGIAWELWYVSDELSLSGGMKTPEYKIVDNEDIIAIYDSRIKPKLTEFIRFQEEIDGTITADIYRAKQSERWNRKPNSDVWLHDKEGDTIYPFETVPAIPFRTSSNNEPVFEAQKSIMDAIDSLTSKTQNEVDRFNALITLFPGDVDKEFIKELTELAKPFIKNLDQYDPAAWPRYLEKNLSGVNEFYASQKEWLERMFHKTIKVPDMNDKEFAGNASGVAIAYKLIGFEFLVSEIEIYFRKGLQLRYSLYKDIVNKSTGSKPNWDNYEQTIVWNRNLPVDDESKVRIAAMLQGLGFDMQIILKYLPKSIVSAMTEKEIAVMLGEVETEEGEPLITSPDPVEAVKLSGIQIQSANMIISQVSEGIITREAGINQLKVFLGLSDSQANQVMGRQ